MITKYQLGMEESNWELIINGLLQESYDARNLGRIDKNIYD